MTDFKKVSVFDFTDYRKYLADYYLWQKSVNKYFSYRYFAGKAGYKAASMYMDIVNRRTGIKPDFIVKLSKAMNHSKTEEEYFENMVLYCQAKGLDEKKKYFERMLRFYNSKVYKVAADQYEFYSKWYYTAIRDLLHIYDFKEDYASIAKSLDPKIRTEQAKSAVALLKKLGLIQKNEQGFFKPIEKLITTGNEVQSLVVKNFQTQMMDLAKESLSKHDVSERNISTLSFGIGNDTYKLIEEEIVNCRKRILGLVEQSKNENRLYQLNFQLFPLSKKLVKG